MSKIANQFQSYLAVIFCSFLANLAVLIQTNKIKGVKTIYPALFATPPATLPNTDARLVSCSTDCDNKYKK